jgi:hypothetical protein
VGEPDERMPTRRIDAMWNRSLLRACAVVGVAVLAACSSDTSSEPIVLPPATATASSAAPVTEPAATDSAATDSAATDSASSEPASTEPDGTEAAAAAAGFERVTPGGDCQCADGSEFSFWVKQADPTKVMFFFQGGGACFSADTCNFASPTYKTTTGASDDPSGLGGIFDTSNPDNPVADWSVVYVPYCTGDVHIGNAATDYGDGLTVQHKGYVNGTAALDELVARFPDAEQVLVAGESAGSVPTPLYAGLVSDRLPDATITVMADGSGAYPDSPPINALVGNLWGTMDAVPDWPENAGVTPETWSLPGLFVKAGEHAPDIAFARHDYAYDQTQTFFAALVGVAADDLVTLIDANEDEIETAGVELDSYIAPGSSHTLLGKDDVYTEEVDGVRFIDWFSDLLAGRPVDDVHCTDCEG